MIATVLHHTLQLEHLSTQVLPIKSNDEFMSYLEVLQKKCCCSKKFGYIQYFKKSGLNNRLSSSLKQSNDTRWNSILILLQSVIKTYDGAKKILCDIGQERRLADIDLAFLDSIVKFFQPFHDATKALEGDDFPTIHHVYQWYMKLKRVVVENYSDSSFVKFLKKRALCALTEKFEITAIHKLALLLHPKFKSMHALQESERNEVLNIARNFLSEFSVSSRNASSCSTQTQLSLDHTYNAPGHQNRSVSNIDDKFLEWQDCCDETDNFDLDEVTCYKEAVFDNELTNRFSSVNGRFNILEFWSSPTIVEKFPLLHKLALGILSIPSPSASSERLFSICGTTVSKCRSQLSSSTVDSIMVLNSNKC